jgi:DNA-binding NtrC family response regulator
MGPLLDYRLIGGTVTSCSGTSSAPSPAPRRIALVVDSGSEINELVDGVFASENWNVQRVPDNDAALAAATGNPFDLIITESKKLSPENLGIVHKIRATRPHARLIILADEFTPGDVLGAMREGAFRPTSRPWN